MNCLLLNTLYFSTSSFTSCAIVRIQWLEIFHDLWFLFTFCLSFSSHSFFANQIEWLHCKSKFLNGWNQIEQNEQFEKWNQMKKKNEITMFDSLIFTHIKQKFDLNFARQRNKNIQIHARALRKSVKIGNKTIDWPDFIREQYLSDLFIRSSL